VSGWLRKSSKQNRKLSDVKPEKMPQQRFSRLELWPLWAECLAF
jgi:hypothetical protein